MQSRIVIIILSSVVVILAVFNVLMFRGERPPMFMPGQGPEMMEPGNRFLMHDRDHGNRFGRNFCGPEFMRERLSLNEGQINRIEELNRKFDRESSVLFKQIRPEKERLKNILTSGDSPDMSEVRKTLEKISGLNVELQMIRIRQGAEIDSILTQQQKETLRGEREKLFERMKRRHGGRDE